MNKQLNETLLDALPELKEYRYVRERLFIRLARTGDELDENIIRFPFLSFFVTFGILLYGEENYISLPIFREMLKHYGITENQLYRDALENTIRMFRPLSIPSDNRLCPDFLILTNRQYYTGTSVILYPGFLKEISIRTNSSLFIIPVSLDFALAFPVNCCADPKKVSERTTQFIQKRQIIHPFTDHILHFSKDTGILSTCSENGKMYVADCPKIKTGGFYE